MWALEVGENRAVSLLALHDAHVAFGDHPLLDGAQLSVQEGERIGLIGRNGSGKSTLLGILAGIAQVDAGQLQRRDGLRIAHVAQEPELPLAPTLGESLAARSDPIPGATGSSAAHGALDDPAYWQRAARLGEFLHRFGLESDRTMQGLSGGERKRAVLAQAFAQQPDLLLLDEPTNHLDIGAVETLETLLLLESPATIVITHDRAFLDRVTTRIVELDRGLLRSYPGNFAAYEARKTGELAAEETARRHFDRFWAQEEAWIRKGVEARRTRNAGRVQRLEQLRAARAARRDRPGSLRLSLDGGERSGRLVAELFDIGKRFGDRVVVEQLSLRIQRGDRLGIIGPNGAGKSTLLRLILGTLPPDDGRVELGSNLRIAYFDQMRAQLDPQRTVAETISPGSDWVETAGQRRHVVSYLGDFLFPARRAQSPVRMLSGGERHRLLLARLFAQPANLLVLDEPTNDLDIESLELLEQTLQDYPGTLLLVSHDRRFLDGVVTQVLAHEGGGQWREHIGGYADWAAQRARAAPAAAPSRERTPAPAAAFAPETRRRMSFRSLRELEALPREIEALEREQEALNSRMASPEYHRCGAEQIRADRRRAGEVATELEQKFARWQALEDERAHRA
ncbi:MAG: ATP-binding cassette domain-containing protein [Gammaproteobacteria bacterium]|nr:ATP-binding cassette domain-containing protein [Gammaproteobacteria bacterium]